MHSRVRRPVRLDGYRTMEPREHTCAPKERWERGGKGPKRGRRTSQRAKSLKPCPRQWRGRTASKTKLNETSRGKKGRKRKHARQRRQAAAAAGGERRATGRGANSQPSAGANCSIRGGTRTRQAEEAESRPIPAGPASVPPPGGEGGRKETSGRSANHSRQTRNAPRETAATFQ